MSDLSASVADAADETLAPIDTNKVDDRSYLQNLILSDSDGECMNEKLDTNAPLFNKCDVSSAIMGRKVDETHCLQTAGVDEIVSTVDQTMSVPCEHLSDSDKTGSGIEFSSDSRPDTLTAKFNKYKELGNEESSLKNDISECDQTYDFYSESLNIDGVSESIVSTGISCSSTLNSSANVTANEDKHGKIVAEVDWIHSKRKLSAEDIAISSKSMKVDAVDTVMQRVGESKTDNCVNRLSRQQLEELVLRQMCRAIASNSLVGQLRRTVRQLSTAAERYQKKYTQLQKQYADLQVIVKRLAHEQSIRPTVSYPLKVTRTVGLQVSVDARTSGVPFPTGSNPSVSAFDPLKSQKVVSNSLLKNKDVTDSSLASTAPAINGSPVSGSASSSPGHSLLSNGTSPSRGSINGGTTNKSYGSVLVDLTDESGGRSSSTCSDYSGRLSRVPVLHPAAFPVTPANPVVNTGQMAPPPPVLKVERRTNGIVLSWTMDLNSRHASIVSYHLFAYQESRLPLRSNPWKKVGDVKALPLPMACTLTQFQEGKCYHFAVRAEDSFRRRGPFSNASTISLASGIAVVH